MFIILIPIEHLYNKNNSFFECNILLVLYKQPSAVKMSAFCVGGKEDMQFYIRIHYILDASISQYYYHPILLKFLY